MGSIKKALRFGRTVLLCLALTGSLSAQEYSEQAKLLSSSAQPQQAWGQTVALDTAFSVVGAPGGNFASVVNITTGLEALVITPSDVLPGDRFGCAVDLSGSRLLVGAWGASLTTGSAYVYFDQGATQVAKLLASDSALGDQFGRTVALSSSRALVGAPGRDDLGIQSGSVYMFAHSGAQLGKFLAADGQPGDLFGAAVAVSGSVCIVGAPGDDDLGAEAGAVYVVDVNSGAQMAKLHASDGAAAAGFGNAVAIDAQYILVGAPAANGGQGECYVFDRTTMQQVQQLSSLVASPSAFGRSLDINSGTAIIGASSSAHLCALGTWNYIGVLRASDAAVGDDGGVSVGLNGQRALLGAPGVDASVDNVGALYLFAVDCNANGVLDSIEIQTGQVVDCDGDGYPDECAMAVQPSLDCDADGVLDQCSIALDSSLDCDLNGVLDLCEITLPGVDCDANGSVDACELVAGVSPDCDGNGVIDACDVAANPSSDQNGNGIPDVCDCQGVSSQSYCLAAGNSSGQQALISAVGSLSLGADNLRLEVHGAVPLQFGMFFYGAGQQAAIYGEGMVCVAPPLWRLEPISLAGVDGTVIHNLDLSALSVAGTAGAILADSTWNFQLWYRDPLGGPAGFNFSDGVQVTFCP